MLAEFLPHLKFSELSGKTIKPRCFPLAEKIRNWSRYLSLYGRFFNATFDRQQQNQIVDNFRQAEAERIKESLETITRRNMDNLYPR